MAKLMMGRLTRQRVFVPGKVSKKAAKAGVDPEQIGRAHV